MDLMSWPRRINVEKLKSNPVVESVNYKGKEFTLQFRIEPFEKWKVRPTPDTIKNELEKVDILEQDLFSLTIKDISTAFTTGGYPIPRCKTHGFGGLGMMFRSTEVGGRRRICRWIDDLPRDPWGYFSRKKILELMGMSKSIFYALLNDENYGIRSTTRNHKDEEDIVIIRKVLEYKGFETITTVEKWNVYNGAYNMVSV